MLRSTGRFLTTHTGSLPRPDDLVQMMFAKEEGVPVDAAALEARVRTAIEDTVRREDEAGIDIVNDGEMSKPSYATYVKDRLSGFGGTGTTSSSPAAAWWDSPPPCFLLSTVWLRWSSNA